MEKLDSQIQLIELLKKRSGIDNIHLQRTLSDLLYLSKSACYRRLSGETNFNFEELQKISNFFKINLSQFFYNKSNSLDFYYSNQSNNIYGFILFFKNQLVKLQKGVKSIRFIMNYP